MKIISIFLLLISFPAYIFAESEPSRQSEDSYKGSNKSERMEELEKANQQLLSRVEIAEHNIAVLEKVLSSMKQELIMLQEKGPQQMGANMDAFESAIAGDASNITDNNSSAEVIRDNDKGSYDTALASLKENKLPEAEEKFANFIKNYPNSSLLANAYFWYGESFFRRNMFDKSAVNYLKSYKQSPKGPKAADSLLKLALSLGALKKSQEVCAIISKLETEFPTRGTMSVKSTNDAKIKFGCK